MHMGEMKMGKLNSLLRSLCAAAALLIALTGCPGCAPARAEGMAEDIIRECEIKVSEGSRKALTDRNVRTGWEYQSSGAQVALALPAGARPALLQLWWEFEPQGFEVQEYDVGQSLLRQRSLSDTFPSIVMSLDMLPETRYVFITMTAPDQLLLEIRIYTEGMLADDVQVWNAPVEKAELMVVSTHQDDELIFFGGTIPYYAVARRMPTVVVYMANCTRYRRQEALSGLWAMGVRDYPEFINLTDKRVKTIDAGIELWGGQENILRQLVWRIRRYKPEVIVTHDFDGEYGHNQHKITAAAMQYAIDAAADPSRFSESVSAFGAWQVKKLYIHLYNQNELYMDWQTPLEELGGISPLLSAQVGYAEHVSQHKYYQVEAGGQYDNAKYGLYSTTVGYDTGKNDFFENIPSAELYPLKSAVQATAEPTASPEPTAAPEATVAPVVEPVSETGSGSGLAIGLSIGAAVLVGAGATAVALHRRNLRRRRRRRRRTAAGRRR